MFSYDNDYHMIFLSSLLKLSRLFLFSSLSKAFEFLPKYEIFSSCQGNLKSKAACQVKNSSRFKGFKLKVIHEVYSILSLDCQDFNTDRKCNSSTHFQIISFGGESIPSC